MLDNYDGVGIIGSGNIDFVPFPLVRKTSAVGFHASKIGIEITNAGIGLVIITGGWMGLKHSVHCSNWVVPPLALVMATR